MFTINNYKNTLTTNASKETIFKALNENIDSWWGKTSNSSFQTGGHFTITFDNGYWWTFRILEHHPNDELIWKCIDGEPEFNKEWIGHVLHWKIEIENDKAILRFQQVGLNPDLECYEVCSTTWDRYLIEDLKTFLEEQRLPELN